MSVEIEDALVRYSHLPRERIELARVDISLVGRKFSIVFVLAAWSGQALVALRELTTVLANDPNAPHHLLVVNADDVTDSLVQELGARPEGNGETFWVRDGRVVASILRWDSPLEDLVRENTRTLNDPRLKARGSENG